MSAIIRNAIAILSNVPPEAVPQVLCSIRFVNVWRGWLAARYRQYNEILTPETCRLWLEFLANEPNPEEIVEAAINTPHNARRKLMAVDKFHQRVPAKFRYAQRTSRTKRATEKRADTVYNPRNFMQSKGEQQP